MVGIIHALEGSMFLERPIIIDEKRGVTITLGVLVHFILTIIIVGAAYATIRNDLANVIIQSARNDAQVQITRELLDKTRLEMTGFSTKLDMFFDSYNRDMNKYVRTDKDRR